MAFRNRKGGYVAHTLNARNGRISRSSSNFSRYLRNKPSRKLSRRKKRNSKKGFMGLF
jgi:hypothetical protein